MIIIMFYIIFDLIDGDSSKTFIGTLQQCVDYISHTYGGYGYENNYAVFNISEEYGFSHEFFEFEDFEHQPRVNIYNEISRLWKTCELCRIFLVNQSKNRYCDQCTQNRNNKFCEECKVCVSTDIKNSMWYSNAGKIYCIDCQLKQ